MLCLLILCITFFHPSITQVIDLEAYEDSLKNPDRYVFRNVCYSSLDNECFGNGEPFFHPIHNPFSAIPDEAKNVKFYLYTQNNPNRRFKLKSTSKSLRKSPYNCQLNTVVINHGYSPDFESFLEMKDALLEFGSFNVIVTDWREYASSLLFNLAAANTRTVGARLALLIKLIWDECETDGSNFYLVGHSMGAHVSGFAGKRLPGLKRITGLDPGSVLFQGLDKECHLDSGDADFVDIIHTNGADFITKFGHGFWDPLGDMDFYANDGNSQPDDCPVIDPLHFKKYLNVTELFDLASCSHSRAKSLFVESFKNSNCTFLAVQCDSYEKFKSGRCPANDRKNAAAGFPAVKIPGLAPHTSFFFRTSGEPPYCIKDSNKPESTGFLSWFLG